MMADQTKRLNRGPSGCQEKRAARVNLHDPMALMFFKIDAAATICLIR